MNTRIRDAIKYILNDEVNPIIDVNGTRYLIDISNWELGTIIWTPFDIASQTIIGEKSYAYPFASHNIFFEAILGPAAENYSQPAVTTTFPSFPVPDENGTVIP